MKKIFKVLCIDGGGIRGVYSSKILEDLEEKFKCNIVNYFDLICGTSTGGLIALALSLKIPAKKITEFYEMNGKKIFPHCNSILAWFKKNVKGGKYDNKELRKALEAVFNKQAIGDSHCLLCIPAYSITDARPYIFKYDHKEGGLTRDNTTKYVDVALATCAAPTYFPLVEIESHNNKQFIDGGVYANNPTFIGYTEALDYFVGPNKEFESLSMLSIASLEVPSGKPTGLKSKRALLDWRKDLVNPYMVGQSYVTDFSMKKLSEKASFDFKYTRIKSTTISADQCHLTTLDNANKEAIDFMKGQGHDQGLVYSKFPEIENFFKEPKMYKLN
ncbi:MAG TPA: CBASS cGAMP-activated phospholipase [Ignavibacteria bacterium]